MASIFTFGHIHCAPNRFVRVESRDKMFELFGRSWAFQYDDTPETIATMHSNFITEIELDDALKKYNEWRVQNGQ